MSDIIKAITDKQLEDVGLKKKETEVISTKRKTTIKPTKKHQQGWLFKASPPKEYPVTGRNGGSNNPKSWQKDDVLRKLDELRSAFQKTVRAMQLLSPNSSIHLCIYCTQISSMAWSRVA